MDFLKLPYEYPFKNEWRIKKAHLEALKGSTKKRLSTQEYYASKIGDVRYCIKIRPYGDMENNEGKALIYLQLGFGRNVKEVKAEYQKLAYPITAKWTIKVTELEEIRTTNDSLQSDTFAIPSDYNIKYSLSICPNEQHSDDNTNHGKVAIIFIFVNDEIVVNINFVNDEIVVNINGTLKFDRPFVSKIAYPLLAKTAFKADDLEALRTEDGENLESEMFDVLPSSDIKYSFRIYPNDSDEIIIALFMTFENYKKLKTHLTFDINSGLYTKSGYQLVESGHAYGFVLCSTEDFFDLTKGYIIDGKTAITLEGHLFVEKKDPEFKLMNADTVSLTSKNQEKNFKITVGENVIEVNKDLLADFSTVFAGMLQSGMKEAIEGKMEITDFPYKTVDAAIKLIYGISPTFTIDDMLPLLVFSDKYDIQLIKDLVEDHLISELLPSNVCQIIHFSDIFNIPKLHEKSTEYFVKCYRELTAVNDLDLLEKDLIHKILFSAIPTLPY